ncbi:MAG: penicillin-binding protein 1A, partial [Caulobacteraceae bacterium]|nr:penicillin-binding protein 1A [Caulobacteraceae bacterium]
RQCPGCQGDYNGQESPRLQQGGDVVLDPITAYQITSMLEGVVQRGTAYQASSLGRPIGGKTGTTNDYRSAWFVGFTPDIIVGVFVGFDDNRSLGDNETGAVDAVPIFISFMKDVLAGTPVHDFKPPAEAKFAYVNGVREAFLPGTEPKPKPVVAPGDELLTPDLVPAAPGAPQPPPAGAPTPPIVAPPPKRPPSELNGLY